MLESVYKISLDIHEINSQHTLFCKQGDTQRRIVATLIEESELYRISEDCTAAFVAVKPDGKVVFNEARIDGNTILYDFTPQTCNVAGRVMCELRLYGYDNAQITSPGFILNVHPAIDTTVVESATEVNVLTGLISEAIALLDTVNGKLANGDFVPKMSIGDVKTLPAGSDAEAWFTGTGTAPVLNLGIPQGPQGQAESLIPDTSLTLDSTKPVQNKVITAALNTKADKATIEAALNTKADKSAVDSAMSEKVDKVAGKGLSTNDYTSAEKNKLAGIEAGANNYSLPVGGVGTTNLADGAVTYAKLANGAVTSTRIADGAVNRAKLAENAKSKGVSVTLAAGAANWVDNAQTATVSDVTTTNNVIVSPAPASSEAYSDAEIRCTAQGAGSLTFTCGSVPDEDVTVNVVILV